MTFSSDDRHREKTEYFSKLLHLLWDLGLVQRFLPERQDLMVFWVMLRYADFRTGECALFTEKVMRETGVKHRTQVKRIQDKIVKMGAFWRPMGKAGFKKVGGKWVRRYYRSTGKQILGHALDNNLISEDALEAQAEEDDIDWEAQEAQSGDTPKGCPPGLDDIDDDDGSATSG